MHASPRGTQEATRGILGSLFPPWLPGAFAVMFSRPMPGLSCQVGRAVNIYPQAVCLQIQVSKHLRGWAVVPGGEQVQRLGAPVGGRGRGAAGIHRPAALSPAAGAATCLGSHCTRLWGFVQHACLPPINVPRCAPGCLQLNAWATWLTCQWLMGECEVRVHCPVWRALFGWPRRSSAPGASRRSTFMALCMRPAALQLPQILASHQQYMMSSCGCCLQLHCVGYHRR